MEFTQLVQEVVKADAIQKTPAQWFLFVVGLIGAISIAIFSLPQIIRIVKTKDTASVPGTMFCILSFGSLCFFVQGVATIAITPSTMIDMIPMSIANFISFAISTSVLGFKVVYRYRAKKLNITEKEYCEQLAKKSKKK